MSSPSNEVVYVCRWAIDGNHSKGTLICNNGYDTAYALTRNGGLAEALDNMQRVTLWLVHDHAGVRHLVAGRVNGIISLPTGMETKAMYADDLTPAAALEAMLDFANFL